MKRNPSFTFPFFSFSFQITWTQSLCVRLWCMASVMSVSFRPSWDWLTDGRGRYHASPRAERSNWVMWVSWNETFSLSRSFIEHTLCGILAIISPIKGKSSWESHREREKHENLKLYHDKRRLSPLSIYSGNVAWAHLCTKNKLLTDPKKVSGLPIFVTDDTPVIDTVRLSQRINLDMEIFKIKPTSWSIPFLLCYLLAMLLEFVLKIGNIFTKMSVEYCPRGLMSFGSSLVLYDRLRASIACEYEPLYTVSEGFSRSGKWYDSWYLNFKDQQKSLRTKSSWFRSLGFAWQDDGRVNGNIKVKQPLWV